MYQWMASECSIRSGLFVTLLLGCDTWNRLVSGVDTVILIVLLTHMHALVNVLRVPTRYELGVLALGFHLWRGWSTALLAIDVVRPPFPADVLASSIVHLICSPLLCSLTLHYLPNMFTHRHDLPCIDFHMYNCNYANPRFAPKHPY